MSELLTRWSSREIAELRALDLIDPLGAWRRDYHAAQICAAVVAAFGGRYEPDRFLFRPAGVEDPDADARAAAALQATAKTLTAKNRRRKKV